MRGAMTSAVRNTLRLEGLLVLAVCVAAYQHLHLGWGRFALCFLLPDLSFAGYLLGKKAGALCYNLAHSYVGPALCGLLFILGGNVAWLMAALIWSAHIGFDRALGYGLKYATDFTDTHLGRLKGNRR